MSLIIYLDHPSLRWRGPLLAPRRQWTENENESATYSLGGRNWSSGCSWWWASSPA
jgi:hypothetical protein